MTIYDALRGTPMARYTAIYGVLYDCPQKIPGKFARRSPALAAS